MFSLIVSEECVGPSLTIEQSGVAFMQYTVSVFTVPGDCNLGVCCTVPNGINIGRFIEHSCGLILTDDIAPWMVPIALWPYSSIAV